MIIEVKKGADMNCSTKTIIPINIELVFNQANKPGIIVKNRLVQVILILLV